MEKNFLHSYEGTIRSCYFGYITQAVVNNFAPLLFLTFERTLGIPLSEITLLVTLNFGVQLLVDLISAGVVDRIGYRPCMVGGTLIAATGLVGLAVFPSVFPTPFAGLCCAVILYAIGGGVLEVLVSPIVEACPSDNKEAAMSLLHSFYCWGHVGVILVSTLFFAVVGIEHWRILAVLWAIVPLVTAFCFTQVPIRVLVEDGAGMSMAELVKSKVFWLLFLMMVCSGAAEQAMSQWASAFAEAGLGVSKTIGDLAGPCCFATMMGLARMFYGKKGEKIPLMAFIIGSCCLCIAAYLIACLTPWAVFGLIGCGLCGLSVGILWPGSFSIAARRCPDGGTKLFALLALGGDLGCGGGPTVVGIVSDLAGGSLKTGLLAGILFPVVLIVCLVISGRKRETV